MPKLSKQYIEQVSTDYLSNRFVRDTERNPMDTSIKAWLGHQAEEAFANTVHALGNDTRRINTLVNSIVKVTQDNINAASSLDNVGRFYLASDNRYYPMRDGIIDGTKTSKQEFVSVAVLNWLHENYPASRSEGHTSAPAHRTSQNTSYVSNGRYGDELMYLYDKARNDQQAAAFITNYFENAKSKPRQPWDPTVEANLQDLINEWKNHAGKTERGAIGHGDGDGNIEYKEILRASGSTGIRPGKNGKRTTHL